MWSKVPEPRKQQKAREHQRATGKTGPKLVESPVITNSFGTLRFQVAKFLTLVVVMKVAVWKSLGQSSSSGCFGATYRACKKHLSVRAKQDCGGK